MSSADIFNQNLQRWAVTFPEDAKRLAETTCEHVTFCTADNGVSNLKRQMNGMTLHLHSPTDPVGELFEWLSTLDLLGVKTVFFYGVGLGYAYDVLQTWLKADPARSLVFIEDDFEVLHRLFECERGTILLDDDQVWIFYMENPRTGADTFGKIGRRFGDGKYKVTGLCSYLEHKFETMIRLNEIIEYMMNINQIAISELREFSKGYYTNFYYNIFDLPYSYDATKLYGKFAGIPAIICGAGPSLRKNIETLRTLTDKAIIFGGGTAMNALNHAGILPHFGVGIDPNMDQILRLITNTAYDVPYFYHRRMNSFALQSIHGEHLYVSSGFAYPLSDRLDKELGLTPKNLNEGYNVINLSLALAHAMGCNPIITIGVDLAYTDEASYSSLADPHPIYANKQAYRTKSPAEELIPRKDIHGKPVLSLWKWMVESMWYSYFALENPELKLINATEGGIGFPGILNMALKEAADKYLDSFYDLDVLIHGEIQNATIPSTVTDANIHQVLKKVLESLDHCINLCERLTASKSQAAVDKLQQEIAYHDILKQFDDHCMNLFSREVDKLALKKFEGEKGLIEKRQAEMDAERFTLLNNAAKANRSMLTTAERNYRDYMAKEKKNVPCRTVKDEDLEQGIYSFVNHILTIEDPSIRIHIQEPAAAAERYTNSTLYYPSGEKKLEAHYLDNALHGPLRLFSQEGILLAENWYCKGMRQGRGMTFYRNGSLFGIKRYRNGMPHGEQLIFYPNGNIKTILNYREGKYHGEVILYFPNGQVKRQLNFAKGLLDGEEKAWNINGKPIIEARYSKGHSVGVTHYWDSLSGQLLKEITFDAEGKIVQIRAWNFDGTPIDMEANHSVDYFDMMVNQAKKLIDSIDSIYLQLESIMPALTTEIKNSVVDSQDLNDSLVQIKGQLDGLKNIGKILSIESGLDPNTSKEPIWKSPSMQAVLEERIQSATPMIEQGILAIQTALCATLMALEERNKNGRNE